MWALHCQPTQELNVNRPSQSHPGTYNKTTRIIDRCSDNKSPLLHVPWLSHTHVGLSTLTASSNLEKWDILGNTHLPFLPCVYWFIIKDHYSSLYLVLTEAPGAKVKSAPLLMIYLPTIQYITVDAKASRVGKLASLWVHTHLTSAIRREKNRSSGFEDVLSGM